MQKSFRYTDLNIYLKLIPFLLFYVGICLVFSDNKTVSDESRYLMFAQNLLQGFYSPPPPNFNLWNGPGYPLVIASLLFLKIPLLFIKILNAFFFYFSLIISYKTFTKFASKNYSLLFTILLALYFPIYLDLPFILTESLTWFLISLVCFTFLQNFETIALSLRFILFAAFVIAYLAMTKIIFGVVIIIMLILSFLGLFLTPIRNTAKKSFIIFFLSFILCLPWLIYTFQITHKPFYWGNSGSMSLYTMSSPNTNELGDWFSEPELSLNPNHSKFLDSISGLNSLGKDEAYKIQALKNIKSHPKKYLWNWIGNIGRLLFSYPNSYTPQSLDTFFTILPNFFVIVFILASLILTFLNLKKIPQELFVLLVFILIYLFGSSLVSAYRRMFYITLPFWGLFILYISSNFVTIKIKKDR